VFGGDALQVRISANGAMCVERITQGHQAGEKARFALFAAPRVQTDNAEKIIGDALSARAACVLALTDWAVHLGDVGQ
jgi:hypothetical protein